MQKLDDRKKAINMTSLPLTNKFVVEEKFTARASFLWGDIEAAFHVRWRQTLLEDQETELDELQRWFVADLVAEFGLDYLSKIIESYEKRIDYDDFSVHFAY